MKNIKLEMCLKNMDAPPKNHSARDIQTGVTLYALPPFFEWQGIKKNISEAIKGMKLKFAELLLTFASTKLFCLSVLVTIAA